ncbi:MAG: BspA family leucine-rich repeat surface protein, partial [Methanobrevibacter sp.]|nr:BspA family leucine-rich repeat surface protein [Methanobrevibacter sp.]
MPGVIHKKRGSGAVFPPDWREIGYSDTPESTMDGFYYAKDIEANWDTSVHTYIEAFKDDYKLMYFPNMSYEKRYSMERCDRMFQNSNLEYFESDLPFIQQFDSAFASCRNLRYAKITGMENWGVNTINQLFVDCYQLEEVDFDFSKLPSSCIRMNSIFSGCWNLKKITIINNYIESAITAFQNTYNLTQATVSLPKCYNTSFYAAGRDTTNGARINLNMGLNAPQNAYVTFESANLAGGTYIQVNNCDSVQSAFRNATIRGITIKLLRNVNPINTSFMFYGTLFDGYADPNIDINAVGNGNSMFENATVFDADTIIDLTNVNLSTATSLNNFFKNSTISSIVFGSGNTIAAATSLTDMFYGCHNFTNDTINEILHLLSTASSYTGTKTLA